MNWRSWVFSIWKSPATFSSSAPTDETTGEMLGILPSRLIGKAVLERIPELIRIELSLPNRHCMLLDLAPFGLDNPKEVFAPTDEPHGLTEAVLARS